MSIRVSIVSVGFVCALFSGSGCNIETCEEGAVCGDDSKKDHGEDKQCAVYCARVTICDPNAVEFNDCVDTCESGFESDPEATAQLCACAEWSTCSDIVGGHCSAKPGTGGTSGSGGSATGGTSAGGTSAGGTGAGGSGATDAGTACAHDCDCPAGENCVSGYCAPARR
jgi:uncharacterized membrane protein YgcG